MNKMPNKMIENVAKALIDRIGSPWPWNEMDPMIKRLWEGHAKAAIEAMREPSSEMICAALDDHDKRGHNQGYTNIWNAMIDEALK